jgi:Ca2+-binding EF-hand superfamily protein
MTTKSPEELRENFDHFDSNGDGRIELHEFESLMEALGVEASLEEIGAIDTDGSGLVDFQEFASWFADR